MKTKLNTLFTSLALTCSVLLFAGPAAGQSITVSPDPVYEGDAVTLGFTGGVVTGWAATLSDGVTSVDVTGTDPTLVVTAPTLAPGATSGSIHVVATYTDAMMLPETVTLDVVVLDRIPPDVSAAEPSVAALWPPNHQMVTVSILGVVSVMNDPNLKITVTSVMQDEPADGLGDGDTPVDAIINADGTVQLRAERSGKGNGRVYTIYFTATDIGGSANGMVTVGVPHDKRGSAAVDDGGLFDSTLGATAPPEKGKGKGKGKDKGKGKSKNN